jgi:hypothetical protein
MLRLKSDTVAIILIMEARRRLSTPDQQAL